MTDTPKTPPELERYRALTDEAREEIRAEFALAHAEEKRVEISGIGQDRTSLDGLGVVIVAHGGLAREYLAAVQHVVGATPSLTAVSVGADDDRDAKIKEICEAADAVDGGEGVVIVTDVFGGGASDLAVRAGEPSDRRIVYGANLPMLIRLARARQGDIDDRIAWAQDIAYVALKSPMDQDSST